MIVHGGVEGGRSQGVAVANDILVTTDGGGGDESQGTGGELMDLSYITGSGDLGDDAAMNVGGGVRVPEG